VAAELHIYVASLTRASITYHTRIANTQTWYVVVVAEDEIWLAALSPAAPHLVPQYPNQIPGSRH